MGGTGRARALVLNDLLLCYFCRFRLILSQLGFSGMTEVYSVKELSKGTDKPETAPVGETRVRIQDIVKRCVFLVICGSKRSPIHCGIISKGGVHGACGDAANTTK